MGGCFSAPDQAVIKMPLKTDALPSAFGVLSRLAALERLWLFLDYDGTLADFAATPDIVTPDPDLIALLSGLAVRPNLRLAVISGRRLKHIRRLIPIEGIWLAGTYGIELLTPPGEQLDRLDYASIRPALERLKTRWENLASGGTGIYLEDKGWALALHARFASDRDAEEILGKARLQAQPFTAQAGLQLLGGHKFLELCPLAADKGAALAHILAVDPFPGALPVFIGDDDKDERAFDMVKSLGGEAVVIAAGDRPTGADYSLESPAEVRTWLDALLRSDSS